MNLLASGKTNAKTSKNKRNTAIMYIAPFNQNERGTNLCPKASNGCAAACLYNSGRGKFSNVKQARVNKANYFVSDKRKFTRQLLDELVKLNNKGKFAVRLNGTSDIDFIKLIDLHHKVDVLESLPNLTFYDYTKVLTRVKRYAGTNYRLTFSRSETNKDEAIEALTIGAPISAVFNTKKGEPLPSEYLGYTVVDGDKADDIMLDKRGAYVLGLRFKGSNADRIEAVNSGFVVNVNKLKDEVNNNSELAVG